MQQAAASLHYAVAQLGLIISILNLVDLTTFMAVAIVGCFNQHLKSTLLLQGSHKLLHERNTFLMVFY